MVSRKFITLASAAVILVSVPTVEHTLADNVDSSYPVIRESIVVPFESISADEEAEVSFNYIEPPTSVIVADPAIVAAPADEFTDNAPNYLISVEAPVQSTASFVAAAPPAAAESASVATNSRIINVALSGGQEVVDLGAGPVLFPLPGFPPYVAEHDYAGGWARFGNLVPGMSVTMTSLVTGDYTVGEIINVPKGATTSALTFSVTPRVILQTCVPGTDRMIAIGLY